MSWFSRIVLGIVFLLVVAIGAAATAVMLINPVDVVSNRLVAQVKQTTGRDLTIKGGTGLSFWPKLAVSLKDVTLSPPPGMTAPDTLRASEVAVRVAIWPLLNGRAQVESVALEAPVFDLRRDTSGRTSWTFAGLKLPLGRTRFAQATGQTATDARSPASRGAADARTLALLDKLELNAVRITRGTVNYTDEQSGHAEAFRNIDITIQGRSLRDRATINGQMLVRGTTMNFDATLGVPRDLLTGRPADIAVKLASDAVAGTLNGKVDLTGATVFRGPLFASSASLSRIAKLAAYQAPNADQLGNVKVAGDLVVRGPEVNLNRARITLGEVQASGALGGRFDGPRPALTADLKINQLDIDKFTAGAAGVAPGALPASSTPGSAAASGGGQPNSIDDLLRRSQVKGFVGRDGWDATPIDTSVLRAADVRVKVQAGPVTGSGVRLDSARLRLALNNGSARLDVDDAKLYDGTLRGIVTLDPAKPGLRLGANLRANGFAARRLLKDFAGVDMLAASTDARIAVGSGGASVKDLASGLAGTAEVQMKNGAIIGWNLAEMVRRAQQGRFDGLQAAPSKKTDFSEMSATFKIRKGVARNSDLKLQGPLLRVTGAGDIDIGRRQLNYVVRPRVVADLTGQGGGVGGGGLEIPVRFKGSWDDPDVRPELGDFLSDPNKAAEAARQIGQAYDQNKDKIRDLKRQFREKDTGEVLDGLLKNDGAEAKKLLEGLFGR